MANELLRTLSIDGVANDALGVGKYLKLDSDNNVCLNAVQVGETIANFSLANNAATNKEIWTVTEAGILIAQVFVEFAANSAGARYMCPMYFVGSASSGLGGVRVAPPPSGVTQLVSTFAFPVSQGDRVGFRVFQNSGAALTVQNIWLAGMLIKEEDA